MSKSRIWKDGKGILIKAHRSGQKTTRHKAKTNPNVEPQKLIFSEKSLENHLSNYKQIADWLIARGYMRLSDIDDKIFCEFLREKAEIGGRDKKGAAKKTLQSYISVYNKIQLIRGYHTLESKLSLKELETDISVRSDNMYGFYKSLTATEWKKANPGLYKKYRPVIEIAQAFGLRRREIISLNTKSFLLDAAGKIYVQTVGKGGKYRVTVATNKLNNRMVERFGEYALDISKVALDKESYQKSILQNALGLNIKYANSHMCPLHIFRAEYAQKKLGELIEGHLLARKRLNLPLRGKAVGYSRLRNKDDLKGIDTQIGLFKGPVSAFWKVSELLGHNRLDVLLHYLR